MQCGKWIHSCFAIVKRFTIEFKKIVGGKYEGNIGESVEQDEKLCDEVKTVSVFTYLGDRVSAGGGCEAAMTASTRCGWVEVRECCELLYGKMFPLRM